MKKLNLTTVLTVLLAFMVSQAVSAGDSVSGKKGDQQQDYVLIRGKVVDKETGNPLVFATIAVKESNVSMVTNIDGEFTLKLPPSAETRNIEISFLGYKNKIIATSDLKAGKNTIQLEAAPIPIKEIIVKPTDPVSVITNAIYNIEKNYEQQANQMTSFYRETIKKNRTYVSIGEAVVEIFKAPYSNDYRFDAAKIYKGRKGSDVEEMDTVLFKLQGGPVSVLQLDLVKNSEALLTREAMQYYDYTLAGVIEIDGRPHYIISFHQKPVVDMPLFMGSLYIDMDTYAISEAEFGYNLTDKARATDLFIKKKPLGMEVTPEVATYRTKYREQNGKWHFEYSRAEVRFKVNWSKKLFHTYYTTMSEIAVTDRTDQEVIKFEAKDKLKSSDIFSEKVMAFSDPDYWGDYNVIEPDQSIESAIKRLSRKLKFTEMTEEE